MGEFYTDSKGRVRPITGGAGVVLAGAVLAGLMAAGGGGTAGGGAVSVQARVSSAKPAARQGQQSTAWKRLGLRTSRNTNRHDLSCVVNSYGQVQQFFVVSPCRSLDRMAVVVDDGAGNTVGVSVAWVRMHNRTSAGLLKRLADTYGTGCVSPLGDIFEPTGQHYESRRSAALVVIAEAEPLSGVTPAEVLDAVVEVAVEFPPP